LTLRLVLPPSDLRFFSLLSCLSFEELKTLPPLIVESFLSFESPSHLQELFFSVTWASKPLTLRLYLNHWIKWFMSSPKSQTCYWSDREGPQEELLSQTLFRLLRTLGGFESRASFQLWVRQSFTKALAQQLLLCLKPQNGKPVFSQNIFESLSSSFGQEQFRAGLEGSSMQKKIKLVQAFHFLQLETLQDLQRYWSGFQVPRFQFLSKELVNLLKQHRLQGVSLLKKQKKFLDFEKEKYLKQLAQSEKSDKSIFTLN
jgi:hypothetical protein